MAKRDALNANACYLHHLSQQLSIVAAEYKGLGDNGSVYANCVQSGLPPERVCFVTTLQAKSGNEYPAVQSDAQVVITRLQPYPSQKISL